MTYDSSLGVVRLTNENEEIAYKMPHKIEQYDSLSNDEKENMKSVYLRNDEDKKKGVKYVMRKILGFYKGCLELGSEYQTGLEESSSGTSENHGGVTTIGIHVHDIVVVDVVEVVVLFDDVVMDGYEIVVFAGAEMLAG
ncbi:hypothetical protein Tco_0303297 [Tanacetum coccineum]